MKFITEFNMDTSDMPQAATVRTFNVGGDVGAVFSMHVKDNSSPNKFYNFKTKTFTTAFVSENRLANIKLEGTYTSSIQIPANSSGDTYTVYLWSEPHFDSELDSALSINPVLYTVTITQVANSTVTFTPITANTTKFATMPSSVTSTGSPIQLGATVVDIDWTISTASTDAGGFGLLLTSQPRPTGWYATTTDTVDGAITSAYNLIT